MYDFVESDNPLANDKVDALINASGMLSIIQDDKVAAQCHFDERQKGVFAKCYGMLSRFEDMLICVVNVAMTIDESLATLFKTYLQVSGSGVTDHDPKAPPTHFDTLPPLFFPSPLSSNVLLLTVQLSQRDK